MGRQGLDEGHEGQDQGDRENQYQGYGYLLQNGGEKIEPSGGEIESGDQVIGNEEGPVQSG